MSSGFEWLEVESLDLEAQGVAHRAPEGDAAVGKVVFIEGALPGERVQVQVARKKNSWEQGQVTAIECGVMSFDAAFMPHMLLPTGERAPLLSLCEQVPAMGAEYLARVLGDSFGILTRAGHHCAHPLHAALGLPATLRVSLAFYNSEDELGRLGAALRGILRGRGG